MIKNCEVRGKIEITVVMVQIVADEFVLRYRGISPLSGLICTLCYKFLPIFVCLLHIIVQILS